MDSYLKFLAAWMAAATVTAFGLSRVMAFGARSVTPARREPAPAAPRRVRRPRRLELPLALAGLALLAVSLGSLASRSGDPARDGVHVADATPRAIRIAEVPPAQPRRRARRPAQRRAAPKTPRTATQVVTAPARPVTTAAPDVFSSAPAPPAASRSRARPARRVRKPVRRAVAVVAAAPATAPTPAPAAPVPAAPAPRAAAGPKGKALGHHKLGTHPGRGRARGRGS